ncbi:MAG: DNA polymerase III subunit alpha, partial [Phycisphaerae bacterium]
VIRYVRQTYGHVAQIITFGTLKARAAIRDVCRVLGVPLADADRLARLVPEQLKMTLEKALKQEPELRSLRESDERVRKVIDIAQRIEGLARHAGVHAAGVVIADQPLENIVPIYRQAESRSRAARNGAPNAASETEAPGADITQFDGTTVEKVGLLKMDFLGLRTLTVLERARQLAGSVAPPHPADADGRIDLARIDLTDPRVFELFAAGDTQGVFQFESGGMRDVLMKMRPNRIEDLIAANALYRPGPMVNIDAYIARKHGEAWRTPHAIMDDVLAETHGIIVYQEQVARLVNRLGGIERKRAFRLAKAISTKKTEMIEAERGPFINGAEANGVKRGVAERIFAQILPFGEYAFNKAHSTGYALIAYQTAYMKTYFPQAYMAALLTFESRAQKIDQWYVYIDECKRMGIEVRPPDVNSSDADFTVVRENVGSTKPRTHEDTENQSDLGVCGSARQGEESSAAQLRFGLAAIKGVGQKAVASIIAVRQNGGRFRDVFDFCERVDLQAVNRGAIEALIRAGAFDTTGAMRKGLEHVLDAAIDAGSSAQADRRSGQLNIFGDLGGAQEPIPHSIPAEEWSESEMLAHEKAVLGFYVTAHPLARHEALLAKYASADCVDLTTIDEGAEVVLGGMISRVRFVTTKSGRNAGSKLALATFEDLTGSIEAIVFSEELARYQSLVAPEKLVFLRGRIDKKREQPSLRVGEVIPLDDASARLTTMVILRLGSTTTAETLGRLKQLMSEHAGATPVFLEMNSSDGMAATVRCNAALSVAPSETFEQGVADLLGAEHVQLIGPARRVRRPAAMQAPDAAPDEPDTNEVLEESSVG